MSGPTDVKSYIEDLSPVCVLDQSPRCLSQRMSLTPMTNKQDDPWFPAASAIFEPFSKLDNMTLHRTRYVSRAALTAETSSGTPSRKEQSSATSSAGRNGPQTLKHQNNERQAANSPGR